MAFDAAWQGKRASAAMCATLALSVMILFCAAAHAAKQPAAKASTVRHTAKAASPLLAEAEALFSEGRVADAKSTIQEELQQNPANAEAYDLLGVISVGEHNS